MHNGSIVIWQAKVIVYGVRIWTEILFCFVQDIVPLYLYVFVSGGSMGLV